MCQFLIKTVIKQNEISFKKILEVSQTQKYEGVK